MNVSDRNLLDRLIRIHALHSECLVRVRELAREPAEYANKMAVLESALDGGETEFEPNTLDSTVAGNLALVDQFRREPRLSTFDPQQVAVLSQFADVRPDGDGMLTSGDPVFNDIARLVTSQGYKIDVDQLLIDDFAKCIGLDSKEPSIFQLLHEMATETSYSRDLVAIDAYVDCLVTGHDAEKPELTGPAAGLRDEIEGLLASAEDDESLRWLILMRPRFSSLPAVVVDAYLEVRDALQNQVKAVQERDLVKSEHYIWLTAATKSLDLLSEDRRQTLDLIMRLRTEVAIELMEQRKFAKIHALEHGWPDLSEWTRPESLESLRDLESAVLNSSGQASDDTRLNEHLTDEKLQRFLRIPPYFVDIYADELSNYVEASQAVAQPLQAAAAVAASSATPIIERDQRPYKTLILRLTEVDQEASQETDSESDKLATVNVVFFDEENEAGGFETTATIDFGRFQAWNAKLRNAYLNPVHPATPQVATRAVYFGSDRPIEARDLLREVGTNLFTQVFSDETLKTRFLDSLDAAKVRVVIESTDTRVSKLPWESLYVPDLLAFMFQVPKFSLVRFAEPLHVFARRTFTSPIRILAVLENPNDAPLPSTEREAQELQETLSKGIRTGYVELRMERNVDMELLHQELLSYQPHIFHFVGHGLVRDGVAQLVLVDADGQAALTSAEEVGNALRDYNINLAVLNGCETGMIEGADIMNSVAHGLIRQGVPAAIATTRMILDEPALMFSRVFYRALAEGYAVETSLVEARKGLGLKRLDWSAYALVASVRNLDYLTLVHQRSGGAGTTAST